MCSYDFELDHDCWKWPLSLNIQTGYGQFSVTATPVVLETAHRMSYKVFKGKIPRGKLICHICDNRWCFNPSHLFIGTHKDNSQDMLVKGRYNHNRNRPRGKDHWRHKGSSKSSAEKSNLIDRLSK